MVHIINGEIVADNDPRVLKIKKQSSEPPNYGSARFGSTRAPGGNITTVNNMGDAPAPPVSDSPFSRFGAAIGMQGTVNMPAIPILCMRSAPVEKVTLLIFVILTLLLGWRALVFGLIIYYIYQAQRPLP
ncbi:hypothetical protein SDRG_16733 [Saprolegnia diclina VS20]|uniref:Uncharacterized protein n=1 Tax=Saprolegnia diclina (strain VS20) TaxID=1156394 RepID=T0PT47_SAPDV|nr:hypothetical protein SDRG_16733 [Saprolegnia diclina VS20]EQC25406.1 hypothetical protein SDRG_16733 [Saprolegnia diclina VS20]|eukprot:XP_008621173.1 hypothetical protein SDRG_16733 [Saprolegnia diclina VS20]